MGLNAVALERRISEERMSALTPPYEPPDWLCQFDDVQPQVWTMDAQGVASRSWEWLDRVQWHDVVALRMEWPHGDPIDIGGLGDWDDDYGC